MMQMNRTMIAMLMSLIFYFTMMLSPVAAGFEPPLAMTSDLEGETLVYGPPLPTLPALASRSGANLLPETLTRSPKTLAYKVQRGDSLYRIAKVFGSSTQELSSLNGIADPNRLTVGQELQVPNVTNEAITNEYQIKQVLSADLTAYTAGPESTGKSPGHPAYGITASGKYVRDDHTIATDPSVIPLGTKVYIEGLGIRTAEDTGSAIIGNRIDVYISDLAAAIQFGVKRNIKVYILEDRQAASA